MYQIWIPKNRNLVIFQNEKFKLWDYSKLENLMQPWPQFADKQYALEWVNYFLVKISLILENDYDIDYANAIGLKNLDTGEFLLFWCKELMFNSADKKNVTLTLMMDVFSKRFLDTYKVSGIVTQSTLPECRYYFKNNKLVFDNANIVYNEGFQFPKTSSSFEVIYDCKKVTNSTQHLFYINQQVIYNPLHSILDQNYPVSGGLSKKEVDKGQGGIVYIWESNDFLITPIDCASDNVLKVVFPCLYFNFINLGDELGINPYVQDSNLPDYGNGVNVNTGLNGNGLIINATFGQSFGFANNAHTYNGTNISLNAKDDFYNGFGVSNGLITLFKRDLSGDTYSVNSYDNVANYIENNVFYVDEFCLNECTYLSSGGIIVSYYDDNSSGYVNAIGSYNYQNSLAGEFWENYRYQYYNILSLVEDTQYENQGSYNNSDTSYEFSNLYVRYKVMNSPLIGSYISNLNDYGIGNEYAYQFKSQLYTDDNYDIKLSLCSFHNSLVIISGSFVYEITSYESFIYSDTLIGELKEFLLIGENNKISITFKNRDKEKYINMVDCYDYYLKKSDAYTDYMLTNGSQYMQSKSYAETMLELTKQMNDAQIGLATFNTVMSVFSGGANTFVAQMMGKKSFGEAGMYGMGASSAISGISNVGNNVGDLITTSIQNSMNLASAQNAVDMLNAQAKDLKRNLDVSYSNKGFDYLATLDSYGGNVGDILLYKISYSSDVKDKINWYYKIFGWKNGNQFELTSDTKKSPKFDYIEMKNIFTNGLPAIWMDMIVNFFKDGIWLINDETIEDINTIEFKDNILYE